MAPDMVPPRFLSLEFHTKFFPQLLRDRLRRKKKEGQGTSFTSTMELIIVLAVCLILAVIGIPALTRGSIVGWILSILGVGGLLALFVLSVGAQWGNKPTYDDFLTGIFFLFVSLGIFAGIPVGMGNHSAWLGVLVSLMGLLGGYALGIVAGMQFQHLGWIAVILNMLAGFAAIVMGGTTLIMLLVLTVR